MPKHEHLLGEDLSSYLDAMLPPEAATRVTTHLAHCALCQAELDGLAAVLQELAGLPPLLPSPEFVERVLAALPVAPVQPAPALRVRGGRLAALRGAAAVLVLSVLLLVSTQRLSAGPVIGLLVRVLTLSAIVLTWCFHVVVAFPGGGAVLVLAPVAGVLLACILLLGTALRVVLRAGPGGLPERAVQP
jgi:hypothetical protein